MKRKGLISVMVLFVMLCLVLPGKAEAATVASGNCGTSTKWTLSDSGTLTISGSGAMADYDSTLKSVPWYSYLGSIKAISIGSSVTHIGDYAFAACVYAKTITIGSGVKTIGEGSFMACVSVTSLSIPKNVTTIGPGAFAQCEGLTSCIYQIDAKLTTIGPLAFYDCYALTRVKLPFSTRQIGESAYENCIALNELYIQKGVEFIGDKAFFQCTALTSVDIPATVTQMGVAVFAHCSALTKLTTTSGGNYVAESNYLYNKDKTVLIQALPSITGALNMSLPGTVTTIGTAAFAGTKNMTSVVIPDSITTISPEAFTGCTGLKTVTLPANLTTLGKGAFYGCNALTQIVLPNRLEHIGEGAFESCTALKSVTFGQRISAIGNDAFKYCYALNNVVIPDTVTYLGHRAFYKCSALGNMKIPGSVVYFGIGVFYGCSTTKTITFLGDAPYFEDSAFTESTIKIFYLEGNTSFTDEVCQNYGGTVTWLAIPDLSYIDGGTCGESAFWWFKDDGTLLICGTGDMITSNYPWLSIKGNIKKLIIEDGITSIGSTAFQYSPITELELPDSMTTIGWDAFRDCQYLKRITVQNSLFSVGPDAFKNTPWLAAQPAGPVYIGNVLYIYNNDGATTYTVREGTFSITSNAFYNCTSLKSVVLPTSLQQLGGQVFQACTSLESITIPDSVKSIGAYTFYGCSALKTVTLGKNTERIGNYAFYGCTALKSISLPASVQSVGENAFNGCKSLQSCTIPAKVTEIPESLFSGCSSLTSVSIGNNVTAIGASAFAGCSITSFAVPDKVVKIEMRTFSNCQKLKTVTLGNSLTYINLEAFAGCISLTTFHVPDSVLEIGDRAFKNCTSLTAFTLGKSVRTLGWEIIQGCPNLTSITVPATVTYMYNTFSGCTSLKEVTFKGSIPTTRTGGFSGITVTAYYPSNDPSWTETERKRFNGTVTWIGYEKEEIVLFEIDVSRMILGNSLEFQFGVATEKLPDITGYYAKFEHVLPDNSRAITLVPATEWTVEGQYYVISYNKLTAVEMADYFYVSIYNEDGRAVSYSKADSVREYVNRAFKNQTNEGKRLLVDMLNYGAAAQTYFNYRTNDLANQYNAVDKSYGTQTAAPTSNNLSKGTNYVGSRLVLENRIQMQVAFTGLNRSMYAVYSYTDYSGKVHNITVNGADFVYADSMYCIELSNLVFADARSLVTIQIYNANGVLLSTVQDSIESYVNRSGETQPLYDALIKFADSAQAFFQQ